MRTSQSESSSELGLKKSPLETSSMLPVSAENIMVDNGQITLFRMDLCWNHTVHVHLNVSRVGNLNFGALAIWVSDHEIALAQILH